MHSQKINTHPQKASKKTLNYANSKDHGEIMKHINYAGKSFCKLVVFISSARYKNKIAKTPIFEKKNLFHSFLGQIVATSKLVLLTNF